MERKRTTSNTAVDTQLPLNPHSSNSSEPKAFNVFEDEDDDDDDLNVTGNLGSKILSTIPKNNTFLNSEKRVKVADPKKKPIKSFLSERLISMVPITLHNLDTYKKVFLFNTYFKDF
jgi:hypothetical protein